METVVACWHHGDLDRLLYHLNKNRIDLYGRNELTEKGTNRLNFFWNRMRLKKGDRIRIVVGGQIIAFATIDSKKPYDLPRNEVSGVWGSAVNLGEIHQLEPPFPTASCWHHCPGSHRFDGPKTSLLAH